MIFARLMSSHIRAIESRIHSPLETHSSLRVLRENNFVKLNLFDELYRKQTKNKLLNLTKFSKNIANESRRFRFSDLTCEGNRSY